MSITNEIIEVPLIKPINYEDTTGDEEFKQGIARLRRTQIQKENEKNRAQK